MEIQYISDANGNHTAVVIPIDEWNKMVEQNKTLQTAKGSASQKRPSDFAGTLSSEKAQRMLSAIEHSKNAWERNI